MTEFYRNIMPLADRLLNMFPCLVIYGARQVGKTTLSKQLRPDWSYFDWQNKEHYDFISRDLNFFFTQYPHNIILDEVQEYPALLKRLRGVIDENRNITSRFILIGSNSPDLAGAVSESLAGRVAILSLATLKTNEYYHEPLSSIYSILFNGDLDKEKLSTCKAITTLEQVEFCWKYGGYPEPLAKGEVDFFNNWFDFYTDNYLNRDIAKLFPKLNKESYRKFISILAFLSGNILNKKDLARNLEISESSIKNYLEIAQGTFLWRMLPSYEKNIVKSVIKMPKGYMRDTGLMHYLMKLDFSKHDIYSLPIFGKSFETFAVEEIIKGIEASGIVNCDPYYYRTRSGVEIDLILEGTFGIIPIEIKTGSSVYSRSLTNIKSFVEEHNLQFGVIVNQADKIMWLSEKIVQIPITYF